MIGVTVEFVLSIIVTALFLVALGLVVKINHERDHASDIWFFFGLTSLFAAGVGFTHLLCAGAACLVETSGNTLVRMLLQPDTVQTFESIGLLMTTAFGFVSLYEIRSEVNQQ